MRDNKFILLIVGVIVIVGCIGAFFMVDTTTYTNLSMSAVMCEVPANISGDISNSNFQTYSDSRYNLTITTYIPSSNNSSNQTQMQNQKFSEMINTGKVVLMSKDNITFNKSEDGLYSYYSNESGVNIVVKSSNMNVLVHVVKTMKINPSVNVILDEKSKPASKSISTTSSKSTSSDDEPILNSPWDINQTEEEKNDPSLQPHPPTPNCMDYDEYMNNPYYREHYFDY